MGKEVHDIPGPSHAVPHTRDTYDNAKLIFLIAAIKKFIIQKLYYRLLLCDCDVKNDSK